MIGAWDRGWNGRRVKGPPPRLHTRCCGRQYRHRTRPPPAAASAPAAGVAVTARTHTDLGEPGTPRRRLDYPREGTEGGEVQRDDSGFAGEPEGQDRRAPGEAWSQLSRGK